MVCCKEVYYVNKSYAQKDSQRTVRYHDVLDVNRSFWSE